MLGVVFSLIMLVLPATSCADNGDKAQGPPEEVPKSALERLLLTTDQVNAMMTTVGMVAHPPVTEMNDHRNLLPNLNCLGAWQVNESAIYGDRWTAMRQVLLRGPDRDNWDNLLVQSVVIFPSTQEAADFLDQSADRWSKCTNHNVNITLNGQPLPRWRSGDLIETDSELTLPFTRIDGDQTRACQRALAVAANLVMDIQACKPGGSSVTQAAEVVDKIKAAMAR
ncbi:sensor domain-containing protein [Mycobacterium sp. DBP42]|nr:sensor domain-containing protein [Mycobacterium sp. DBP42]